MVAQAEQVVTTLQVPTAWRRAFAACQQQLLALHRAEQRGKLAIYYADEVRFSRHAPVPYAWQRRGQPPVGLPAGRGAGVVIGRDYPAPLVDIAATGRAARTALYQFGRIGKSLPS